MFMAASKTKAPDDQREQRPSVRGHCRLRAIEALSTQTPKIMIGFGGTTAQSAHSARFPIAERRRPLTRHGHIQVENIKATSSQHLAIQSL